MAESMISVEVVHALPERQVLLTVEVPSGATAREAVLASGMQAHFPALNLQEAPLGIFGKALAKPGERVLESGDRVEIYRPLLVDPKEVRKQRAAIARARAQGSE